MSTEADNPEGKLTAQQQVFVREYCVDRNGKQAAIRAGYSAKTAEVKASKLLSIGKVRSAVDRGLAKIAKKTETDAEWVRRRLKEEAEDFSEGASSATRVRAVELIGKINGVFEADNKQRAGLFDQVPKGDVERIVERLRELRRPGVAGEPAAGTASRFTH